MNTACLCHERATLARRRRVLQQLSSKASGTGTEHRFDDLMINRFSDSDSSSNRSPCSEETDMPQKRERERSVLTQYVYNSVHGVARPPRSKGWMALENNKKGDARGCGLRPGRWDETPY
jgi:hypothetical protein